VELAFQPVFAFTPKKMRCWKQAESEFVKEQFSTVTRENTFFVIPPFGLGLPFIADVLA
jgi:hypothetical protein